MFAVVATLTDALTSSPCEAWSTYCFVAASFAEVGAARFVIFCEFKLKAEAWALGVKVVAWTFAHFLALVPSVPLLSTFGTKFAIN